MAVYDWYSDDGKYHLSDVAVWDCYSDDGKYHLSDPACVAVWDWYSDDGEYHLSDVAVRLFKIGTVMMVNIICQMWL